MTQKQEHLDQFVQWCAAHIRGDEKGEAQIFLDRLFRAFDQLPQSRNAQFAKGWSLDRSLRKSSMASLPG
jgi:hypothetical protein